VALPPYIITITPHGGIFEVRIRKSIALHGIILYTGNDYQYESQENEEDVIIKVTLNMSTNHNLYVLLGFDKKYSAV
jgi:hypothetical protein